MIRSLSILLALAACTHASPPAATPPEPLPLEYFFTAPTYRLPRVAPDGRSYSIVVSHGKEEVLSIIDLQSGKATPLFKTADRIRHYWWKSQDLLLLLLEHDDLLGLQTFEVKTKKGARPESLRFSGILNPMPEDPENVLLCRSQGTDLDPVLFNLRTQRSTVIATNSGFVQRWFSNAEGKLIAGFGRLHEKWFMLLAQGDGWRRVELGEKRTPDFLPAMVAEDQRRLIGFDYAAGDTVSVVAWDPANDAKELLIAADSVDPYYLTSWSDDWTRMQCVAYEIDRPRLRYFNPEDQAIADSIDAALPHTTNYITSTSLDKSQMVVLSTSDRVPSDYYLFDVKARRLARLGFASSKLPASRLAESTYFDFAARDGMKLHGRITMPPGTRGPCPTVLITNLGLRTRFGFSPREQALASRGYAVVEIDPRGSQGYGEKYWAAGNQQIDGRMVEDLLDGLDWLGAKGLIDLRRVAIGSYGIGGLLAMQAVTQHPERFAALVNFWMPSNLDYFDYMEFVYGRLSKDEVKSRHGGEVGMHRYIESLNPLGPLTQLRVPSFHYYLHGRDDTLSLDDRKAKRAIEKNTAPHVFLESPRIRSFTTFWEILDPDSATEWKRIFTELLPFLDRHVAKK